MTWFSRNKMLSGAIAVAAIAVVSVAYASGFVTNGLPPAGGSQYPTTIPLTGNELLPVDTQLSAGQNPQSEAVSISQLAGYMGGVRSNPNVLIGGDATTNLFQRATTGASVTTTLTYGGPDRWAYWSGTNTAMTVSRDSAATDIVAGSKYAFKMARTSGQTGVVQVCMAQEVESVNVYQLQGQTVELSFNAYTGANFSPTNANMTAYIITGTGTDEGLAGSASMANGLNAGGGGTGTWTGQANATAAVISLGAVSTAGRYAAVATVPATATELGVALCFTPVGTAGTNDYVAFSNIQLVRNPALAGSVSTTAGYSCANIACSVFDRRNAAVEAQLQQRYFYKIAEGAAITQRASCAAIDTTHTNCLFWTPVTMRVAPTFSGDGGFTAGFATPTTTSQATLGNCSALALAVTVTSAVASPNTFLITCTATTIPAAGVASFMYDNGGSGVIKATAEL